MTEIAIMRLMDIILTLPSLLLAIVIVAILGPGLMNAMLAVAVVVLPHYVRITRAAVITEMSKDYVTAARANGAGVLRLMFNEVLPNCAAPLIVQASLGVSTAILDAAALGFLGLGAQPPASEWGTMLADAREFVLRAWWVVTFPGLMILDHRARVQLAGRRVARRARPEAQALSRLPADTMALLEIEDLHVDFPTQGGVMHAVDGVDLTLDEGEVLGIVGESGSGKSVTMLALLGLVAFPGRVRAKRIRFAGRDLPGLSDHERRKVVGKDLAMIFQDPDHEPQSVLHHRLPAHRDAAPPSGSRPQGRAHAAPRNSWSRWASRPRRAGSRTFRTSCPGGMNQRVMIAMAIACNPRLLIADEPTTALDVTIQAQILDLLRGLQRERGMALVLVTHNMGVVVRNGPPRRRDVRRPGGRGARRRRSLRRAAAPLHGGVAVGDARAQHRRAAPRDHSGHGAGPLRSARRLPFRAALQLRHRPPVPPAPGASGLGRAAWSAAISRSASPDRDDALARDRQLARPAA